MNPLEFDQLPDEVVIAMMAKYRLDLEYRQRTTSNE